MALCFIGAYITKTWKWSEFAFSLAGALPLLAAVWYFCLSNLRRQSQFAKAQMVALGEDFSCSERLPFGVLAANDVGIGVTYTPMTEVKLEWSQIRAYTLSKFGKSLVSRKFDPDCPDPRLRSWPKPVLILQTSRADFPVLPLVFNSMESASRWVEVFEHRKPTERGFKLENYHSFLGRVRSVGVLASLVLVTISVVVFTLNQPPFHLLNDRTSLALTSLSNIAAMFSTTWAMSNSAATLAMLQAIMPDIEWDNSETTPPLQPAHGALWISESQNALERIGLDEIDSISCKLKAQTIWGGRDIFKKATLDQADLTLNLNRSHDRVRIFSMTKLGAERSIASLLAERPDLQIRGADNLVLQPSH